MRPWILVVVLSACGGGELTQPNPPPSWVATETPEDANKGPAAPADTDPPSVEAVDTDAPDDQESP